MAVDQIDDAALLALLDGCAMAEDANAIPALVAEGACDYRKASKRPARSSWRLQRRNELNRLRETEAQLLDQLGNLRQAMRTKSRCEKRNDQNWSLLNLDLSNWEQICERQELRRHKSEEENLRLKDELRWRRCKAKTLLTGFKRRMRNEIVGVSMELCKRYEVDGRGVNPPTDDEKVFQELLVGIDDVYAGVDTFFKNIKMHELPCPGRRSVTPASKTEGNFVEFLDTHAVPFDLQTTERAVWTCMREEEPQSPKPAFVQYYTEDDSTLKQSMCSSFTAGSVRVRVIMRKVGRKYVEQDRAVFIFRRLIEPVDVGVYIAFQETTRLIVQRGLPSDLGPTAVIQSHRQGTANMPIGIAYDIGVRWVPRAFIDMGVAAWENSITQFNHFVEDTLLRELR